METPLLPKREQMEWCLRLRTGMNYNHPALCEFEDSPVTDRFLTYYKNLSNKDIFPKLIAFFLIMECFTCLPECIVVESVRQKKKEAYKYYQISPILIYK